MAFRPWAISLSHIEKLEKDY